MATVTIDVTPVELGGDPVTQGDDLQFDFTLVGAVDITGASVRTTIRPVGESGAVIADFTMAITSAAPADGNPTVRATIPDTTSDSLKAPNLSSINEAVLHIGDILVTKTDGTETTYGPYQFAVRRRMKT